MAGNEETEGEVLGTGDLRVREYRREDVKMATRLLVCHSLSFLGKHKRNNRFGKTLK